MARREKSQTVQLAVRMKEPLRMALEEAARKRGVSMNAETVSRLERSLEEARRIEDVFGSRELYGLVRAIASILDMVGRISGFRSRGSVRAADAWIDDPYAYDQAVKAANAVLEAMRPAGDIDPPKLTKDDPYLERVFRELGASLARGELAALAGGPLTKESQNRIEELRKDLGRLVDRPGVTR